MRFRRVMIAALCTAAAVPAGARAGDGCRAVSDRLGDARHLLPAPAEDAGGAIDLTGFAVYPAGWGDLVVEVAVADLHAGWHPLADARSYVVEWRYGARRFRFEAQDARGRWSFAATRAPAAIDAGNLEPEVQWPLAGIVDPEARSIRMTGFALILGEQVGGRVLERVQAWAEERRSTGSEGVVRVASLLDDRAPDTGDGWTRIDLDEACAPAGPVGATPLCRVLEDGVGDAALAVRAEPSPDTGFGAPADLTGVFVGSTAGALVLERGVVDTAARANDTDTRPVYAARFDLDGRTYVLQARRDGDRWSFRMQDHLDGVWNDVAGAATHDRVRFEVPFARVPGATDGARLVGFTARADEELSVPGSAWGPPVASDQAPDDASTVPPARHRLGGPCDPHA